MAKYSRRCVGSVLKDKKDASKSYVQLRKDSQEQLLKAVAGMGEKGLSLNLESKAQQLANLDAAEAAGKISGENATKARERITKIPDWVRFEIILLEEK